MLDTTYYTTTWTATGSSNDDGDVNMMGSTRQADK